MRPTPQVYLHYLQTIKDQLKTDPVVVDMCREHKFDPQDLDLVPVRFGDIDVSARTDRGVITLNWKLWEPKLRDQIPSYLVHELEHHIRSSRTPTQSADDGDYLANPDEQSAFQRQLEFIDNHQGTQQAYKYVDQVLDHHGEMGSERKQTKDILLDKVT